MRFSETVVLGWGEGGGEMSRVELNGVGNSAAWCMCSDWSLFLQSISKWSVPNHWDISPAFLKCFYLYQNIHVIKVMPNPRWFWVSAMMLTLMMSILATFQWSSKIRCCILLASLTPWSKHYSSLVVLKQTLRLMHSMSFAYHDIAVKR